MSAKKSKAVRLPKAVSVKLPRKLLRQKGNGPTPEPKGLMGTHKRGEPLEGSDNLRIASTARAKKRMLLALEKHLGTVMYAAREAGISRKTHYEWMHADPEYREAVENVDEGVGDFVVKHALRNVRAGNASVQQFFLRTKYGHRGYRERQEISGPNGTPIDMVGDLTIKQTQQELPPSAIEEIMRKMLGGSDNVAIALKKLSGK